MPTLAAHQPWRRKCCGSEMASGIESRKEVVNVQALVVLGRRPVMKLWRVGLHHGNCVYARVKVRPRLASASTLGVMACVP